MDGGYDAVTFICSKTDDISATEAIEALGLEEQLEPMWKESTECEGRLAKLRDEVRAKATRKSTLRKNVTECIRKIDIWQATMRKVKKGEKVYPSIEFKKRKRPGVETRSRVQNRKEAESREQGAIREVLGASINQDRPLTKEQVAAVIMRLRSKKERIRETCEEIDDTIIGIKADILELTTQKENIESNIWITTVEERNEFSKTVIQSDFAAGLKELDMEESAEGESVEEDPEGSIPAAESRDYAAIAETLPVFCVSARDYQKLKGRFPRDSKSLDFVHPDQTEIPALRAHCEQLATTKRTVAYGDFGTHFSALCNSLKIWISNLEANAESSPEDRTQEVEFVHTNLDHLEAVSAFSRFIQSVTFFILPHFGVHTFY